MRKKMNLLTACVLISGSVFALDQQDSDRIEDIMNELMNYTDEQAPAALAAPPSATVADSSTEAPAKAQKKPAPPIKQDETPSAVENSSTLVVSAAPVEKDPKPSNNEYAVILAPAAPVEKDPEQSSGEDTATLADLDVQNMDMDEIFLLLEKASQQEEDIIDGLQDLVDLIENEPENITAQTNLLARLKNTPKASWSYLEKLQEDRAERNRLGAGRRMAEIDGLKAVDAAWSTDLVLRTYELVPGSGKRMRLGNATSAVDVEMLFAVVNFPKGSSAIYQSKTETIYVKNTMENLAVLETMLETMGILKGGNNTYQVEIEAKFVEVSEGTLEELGFQWNLNDPYSIGNLELTDGPEGSLTEPLRGNPVPFQKKIDLGDGSLSASGDWSSFRFVDTFNTDPASMTVEKSGNGFDVLISALDQSSGADVLSAPRILTRSGEEATIQVGDIHSFPEVYEGDSAEATIVNISYKDFKDQLLGVELTVTPKVTAERDIMVQLNPRISELVGWQSYQLLPGSERIGTTISGQAIYSGSHYNHRQLETAQPYVDHDQIVASLPIIKRQEIKTQVTMADGSTIGMGGLISESIEAFDDRVPILGSIPMIGRLFRSEGERVVKQNLIMFVTAKIVDPTGRVNPSRSFDE